MPVVWSTPSGSSGRGASRRWGSAKSTQKSQLAARFAWMRWVRTGHWITKAKKTCCCSKLCSTVFLLLFCNKNKTSAVLWFLFPSGHSFAIWKTSLFGFFKLLCVCLSLIYVRCVPQPEVPCEPKMRLLVTGRLLAKQPCAVSHNAQACLKRRAGYATKCQWSFSAGVGWGGVWYPGEKHPGRWSGGDGWRQFIVGWSRVSYAPGYWGTFCSFTWKGFRVSFCSPTPTCCFHEILVWMVWPLSAGTNCASSHSAFGVRRITAPAEAGWMVRTVTHTEMGGQPQH